MAIMHEKEEAFNEVKFTSEVEQFETMLITSAPLAGSYYEGLIASGLPEELACKLTLDWHHIFGEKVMKNATNR